MVCVAWVFFRAESVGEAVGYLTRIFLSSDSEIPISSIDFFQTVIFILTLLITELFVLSAKSYHVPRIAIWLFYIILTISLISFSQNEAANFIYFQF